MNARLKKSVRLLGCAAVITGIMLAAPAARAASQEAELIGRARAVVNDLRTDREFGNAKDLLRRARGVFIVPQLVKGGFFFGAEGGSGVLMRREGAGWSDPAFYTMGSASFGLQAGVESAEVVMLIMTDRAMRAFLADEFKIGADAGLTIATLGSNAEIATTAAPNADVVVWSSASGAYAGITLNGSIIKPRVEWNQDYYHNAGTTAQVFDRAPAVAGEAGELRHDLASIS